MVHAVRKAQQPEFGDGLVGQTVVVCASLAFLAQGAQAHANPTIQAAEVIRPGGPGHGEVKRRDLNHSVELVDDGVVEVEFALGQPPDFVAELLD